MYAIAGDDIPSVQAASVCDGERMDPAHTGTDKGVHLMNQAQLLDYAQTCLILVLRLSLIPIIVATVIGLIVSLLQALTQIQEQTLGFAVKLIAIAVTIMAASSWMGGEMLLYTQDIFTKFPLLGR